MIYPLDWLLRFANDNHACIGGNYVPARPMRFGGWMTRLRAAWLVLTDKADVVVWPGGQR